MVRTAKPIIALLLIGILLVSGCIKETDIRNELKQKFSDFKIQHDEKTVQGYNCTESEKFEGEAKTAFNSKSYDAANELLDKAIEALEKTEEVPTISKTVKKEAKEKLSKVEVAILYEKINDGIYYDEPYRTVDDVVNILKETNTSFVFRVWWRWSPCPESPETAPSPIYYRKGYTYQQFEEVLTQLKGELPEVIFYGAIPAQRVNFEESNPVTGEIYGENETWDMALDPAKWGITSVSKEQLQTQLQEHGTGKTGYFPDITNLEFQKLLLSCAKKQIDSGADAIWIDMLFAQARIFEKITGDPEHPAVKESYEAASKIVDDVHVYGYSKGEYIYVGTFWNCVELPYPPPNVDFVTAIPSKDEIASMEMNKEKWDYRVGAIRIKLGDVPILALIDWAITTDTSLGEFSQSLSKENQSKFLEIADEFFQSSGIVFVYPVHGGFMGQDATIITLGKSKTYDSLAPEFETYKTITELANRRER